jgi:uncharacterized protein
MRLTEIDYSGPPPVDGYGPGFFRVAGEVHEGGLLLLPTGRASWGGYEDAGAILAAAAGIDVLLVGTGPEIAPLPRAFRDGVEAAGVGVEIMASATACRSYNMLLAEGRRVALAALPV